MKLHFPEQGIVVWPVGTGDSTTIRIDRDVYMQVDLHHMEQSEDPAEPARPVIDELITQLPRFGGRPRLSAFALTHPDQDHCKGFEELNRRVLISEIWMSPRTFREHQARELLCNDANAFAKEAMRRVKKSVAAGGDPGPGNRIRIIGYDVWLRQPPFRDFPRAFRSTPGDTVTQLDGQNCSAAFSAFIHAPFKDDSFGDRNDCSLAFQIALKRGPAVGKALLLGDLSYPVLRRVFSRSNASTLEWNVLLAPHHCSKSTMFWREDNGAVETLRSDIVRDIGNAALSPAWVVSSSRPVPGRNKSGENPPHARAKAQFLRIVPNEFLCTHEHPNRKAPEPIVFELGAEGLRHVGKARSSMLMREALMAAGGRAAHPSHAVGFGGD